MADSVIRQPPHSIQAEQSVLGGLMLVNSHWPDVSEHLSSADFYREDHRQIFATIARMLDAGEPVDFVTLSDRMRDSSVADMATLQYLGQLANDTPSASNTVAYARHVREASIRRQLIGAGQAVVDQAFRAETAEQALDKAQQAVMGVGELSQAEMPMDISEHMDAWEDRIERQARGELDPSIAWGLKDLDVATGGIGKGDLCFVLARPGIGKTVLAMNLCDRAAQRGEVSLLFSLEMPRHQLIDRVMSARAKVNLDRLRKPERLTMADFEALAAARKSMSGIIVDDRAGLNMNQIKARARRVARSHPLSLIVVDFFQLLKGCGEENRTRELDAAAYDLKGLAKELDVAVVVPTQVGREVEKRENKRPRPSDARDCGAIEQAGDLIISLYRAGYYSEAAPQHVAEAIICKQRNGPQGTVKLCWRGEYCRFDDLAHYDLPPEEPHRRRSGFRAD